MRDEALEASIQSSLDGGSSVWVVGDIHGYRETFAALLDALDLSDGDRVVCIGDLIDRGPDSLGVMRIVRDRPEVSSIRGNHDEMLRLSLSPRHGGMMKSWLKFGGKQTLASMSGEADQRIELARSWVGFVESLPTQLVLREFRLVHAGFVPGKPLDEQNNHELMSSREIFQLRDPLDLERQIIVGHTTTQVLMGVDSDGIWESQIPLSDGRPSVLGIDTGIYLPKEQHPRLTAINLADGTILSMGRIEEGHVESTP